MMMMMISKSISTSVVDSMPDDDDDVFRCLWSVIDGDDPSNQTKTTFHMEKTV